MYQVGKEEIDAISEVLLTGKLFRYGVGTACATFEERYAKFLGVKHAMLTSSGWPPCRIGLSRHRMETKSLSGCTTSQRQSQSWRQAIGGRRHRRVRDPRRLPSNRDRCTRAIIPVHMWEWFATWRPDGIAKKHNLKVIEDACQCVGGAYKGRKVGSIGNAGGFSFNFYKNMTAGEGGCAVTSEDVAADKIACMIDCCRFYWEGRDKSIPLFAAPGARASEIEGAILNVQLDGSRRWSRNEKAEDRIINALKGTILTQAKANHSHTNVVPHDFPASRQQKPPSNSSYSTPAPSPARPVAMSTPNGIQSSISKARRTPQSTHTTSPKTKFAEWISKRTPAKSPSISSTGPS